MIKVLNLYAGIGGNRKLWPNEEIEVTAIELNPEIAKIYNYFFPNDKLLVTDAHKYLLEHYTEFDFIWTSPPCPTHSRMRFLWATDHETKQKIVYYPDMKLYEEIIFLSNFFKGLYVVENVISYYDPLIKPQISGKHYFWANFNILKSEPIDRHIRRDNKKDKWGFDLSNFDLKEDLRTKMLNNLVNPILALNIFKCAFKTKQKTLIENEMFNM